MFALDACIYGIETVGKLFRCAVDHCRYKYQTQLAEKAIVRQNGRLGSLWLRRFVVFYEFRIKIMESKLKQRFLKYRKSDQKLDYE